MKDNSRPLKIAMAVASPFPANHGTPGSIREMAEAIAQKGHHVHVVTYHHGEGDISSDVKIHRIIDLGFKRKVVVGPTVEKPILDLLMVFTLCRVVIKKKIDLIHAHNYEGALAGYLASIITRRPMIYNAINTMSDELPSYNFIKPRILAVWLARFLDYWVPRMANSIIPISDEISRFLLDKGIKPDKIHVIPLGIDTAFFNDSDKTAVMKRYQLDERRIVIYTGILDQLQRIDYLLKAMRLVVDKIGNAKLLLAANIAKEEDIQECAKIIKELNLQEHVNIITNVSFAEIPSFLSSAKIAVVGRPDCPGFPVKLLNYMAAGKAIVVFKGSAKRLQHMKNAYIVDDHDWKAMGEGIVSLLENPSLAETLGKNAKQWVNENLGWQNIAGKIEDVYYSLLERPSLLTPEPKKLS